MTEREALNLALEALQDYVDEYGPWSDDSGAQYVLRVGKEALAQHVAADDTSQERVDETAKQRHEPVVWGPRRELIED